MKKYLGIVTFFLICACGNSQRPVRPMPHYDLTKPQVFTMPAELREISGIALMPGSNDSVLAEQDEEGKVYFFKLGDQTARHMKFGAKGDYEDITLHNNRVYLLRSDGTLFAFPLARLRTGGITDVKQFDQLLPKGEYEGMFANGANNKLYVLCKKCAGDKPGKSGGGSVFTIMADGSLSPAGGFSIDVKLVERLSGEKKMNFHPSALAFNGASGEWFILSSVNSMIVLADADFTPKNVYPLNKSFFPQPEGIAFDSLHNLYISNEGGTGSGSILKFAYKK